MSTWDCRRFVGMMMRDIGHVGVAMVTVVIAFTPLACSKIDDDALQSSVHAPDARQSTAAALAVGAAISDAGSVDVFFTLGDNNFVENELSRDPFRSFQQDFVHQQQPTRLVQRNVMLDSYTLDELKLIGIVTGRTEPRAMLVDPTGKGWIVRRGQYIGKPELIRGSAPGSPSVEVNWRVDAIRATDIVVVRQNPAEQGAPRSSRIIALHADTSSSL